MLEPQFGSFRKAVIFVIGNHISGLIDSQFILIPVFSSTRIFRFCFRKVRSNPLCRWLASYPV
jgi:hypothetical protein